MTQNIENENDIFSEFRTMNMNNNYQTISESETILATNETNFNSQSSNSSKLPARLAQYTKIFLKSKYDVGKI